MKLGIIILVVLLALAGAAYYFLGGIQDAGIKEFRLTGIRQISTGNFSLNGDLVLDNPSRVSVNYEKIDYRVVLLATNETVAEGELPGGIINVGETIVPMTLDIRWLPAAETLASLATNEKVNVELRGDIYISGQKFAFSDIMDAKEALLAGLLG